MAPFPFHHCVSSSQTFHGFLLNSHSMVNMLLHTLYTLHGQYAFLSLFTSSFNWDQAQPQGPSPFPCSCSIHASIGMTPHTSVPFLLLFLCRLNADLAVPLTSYRGAIPSIWPPSTNLLTLSSHWLKPPLQPPNYCGPTLTVVVIHLWSHSLNSNLSLVTTSSPSPSASLTTSSSRSSFLTL